ncbi:MAG TPA: acyltransferase [Capsulimonadaceae bacterium]|jgi:peptidoglycan/LPS O-acetylase OafA/YrhL
MSQATTIPVDSSGSSETPKPARIHLDFLDGIRGLAALVVVFSHVFVLTLRHNTVDPQSFLGRVPTVLFTVGHASVAFFIVLSGYCLMLPVSRSGGVLSGGLLGFLKRRSRRILPPYFAALVFSVLLLQFLPTIRLYLPEYYPVLDWKIIVSHALLIHNVLENHVYKINGAHWSVATEWQIYFVFALMLLPVYRRFGIAASVVLAGIIGVAPHFLFRGRVDAACFQYVSLFGFGMLAAEIGHGRLAAKYLSKAPFGRALIAAAILSVINVALRGPERNAIVSDAITGFLATALIAYCTSCLQAGTKSRIVAFLSSPVPMALGAFSYSLYLVHDPLLYACVAFTLKMGLSAGTQVLALCACVPLLVLVAYGFHLIFEKPFMTSARSTPKTHGNSQA